MGGNSVCECACVCVVLVFVVFACVSSSGVSGISSNSGGSKTGGSLNVVPPSTAGSSRSRALSGGGGDGGRLSRQPLTEGSGRGGGIGGVAAFRIRM